MRALPLYAIGLCAFFASNCLSQAPSSQAQKPGQVHCSIEKPTAITDADRAYAGGDAAAAETLYAAQVAASPATASYAGLVRAQLEQNKLTEALASAQKAASAAPASAEAESLVGDALLRSGMIGEALTAYRKALALDQCSPRAHFGLGRLNELNAAHATAAHELANAHALAPSDPEITAAFLETQPPQKRLPGLQALLASAPALPPEAIDRLKTEAAILNQGKSCKAVSEFPGAKVELLPVLFNGKYARSWGLRTKLNGTATPLLELDTSVSGIVLNPRDARQAGVKPLISPPASPDAGYAGYVDRVHIGDVDYHDCPVRVVPDSALAGGNSLIGTDFFRDHLIHIDYVASMLTLSPLPERPGVAADGLSDRYIAPAEKDWSPVYIAGPGVLLPTFINKQGPFLFMLDTGISRSVVSPAVTSSLLTAERDSTLNLQGTAAEIVKVLRREGGGDVDRTEIRDGKGALLPVSRPFKLPVYHFTNNEVPDKYSVSFDLSSVSHEATTEVSGLLGFGILRSYFLDINYRDGLARILYDQNRTYETRQTEGFH